MAKFFSAICLIMLLFSFSNYANASIKAETTSKQELYCMTQVIYWESGSEPVAGRYAVATVVMNRIQNGKFADSVCGIVHQRNPKGCQFSFVCMDMSKVKIYKPMWDDAEDIAKHVLYLGDRNTEIERQKALWFHNKHVHPDWHRARYVTTIGGHLFYSEQNVLIAKR